jgi:hypothetical protein
LEIDAEDLTLKKSTLWASCEHCSWEGPFEKLRFTFSACSNEKKDVYYEDTKCPKCGCLHFYLYKIKRGGEKT